MDLCFLIDTSASICGTDPNYDPSSDTTCDNWKAIIEFVYRSVENMDIGENATRVGIVVFATKAYRRLNLTGY